MLRKFYYWLYLLALLPAVISVLTDNFWIQLLMVIVIVCVYYYYKIHYHNYMYEKYEDIVGPKQAISKRSVQDNHLKLIKEKLPNDPEVLRFISEKSKLKTWQVVVVISFIFVLYFK